MKAMTASKVKGLRVLYALNRMKGIAMKHTDSSMNSGLIPFMNVSGLSVRELR